MTFCTKYIQKVCEGLNTKINSFLVPPEENNDALFSKLSNLVSRLKSQTVIHNKSQILYFLYLLSPISQSSRDVSSHLLDESISNPINIPSTEVESSNFGQTRYDQVPENPQITDWDEGLENESSISIAHDSSRLNRSTETSSVQHTLITEADLLSSISYVLQGISTEYVQFKNELALLSKRIPVQYLLQMRALSETGLLYQELKVFSNYDPSVSQSIDGDNVSKAFINDQSLALQSLKSVISKELTNFLALIASLDSQIRADASLEKPMVTIRRCIAWTQVAKLKLRILSSVVNDNMNQENKKRLIQVVSKYNVHGDPLIQELSDKILTEITGPLYEMIENWIYKGELVDPYQEFFVKEKNGSESHDHQGQGDVVWKGKYFLDKELIPSFLSEELVDKIFLIGKSLNFARYGCGDFDWAQEHYQKLVKKLSYRDPHSLETVVDKAYTESINHLVYLMEEVFHLTDHLKAIKKYLLLGQGDFVDLLMESLGNSLDQPANTLFRHNLTASLESAIRSSNASYEPEYVLKRLDARLLELSHGETGWDVFTLEYKVDSPINVIITPYCSRQYLKIFNFLWRLKRIEFALAHSWRRVNLGERNVFRNLDYTKFEWHFVSCHLAEMIHFVCQLQYYILFEVIEISWQELQLAMEKPNATLDTYIEAHEKYVTSITHKGLLGGGKSRNEDSFLHQLHDILKVILNFHDAIELLYNFSCSLSNRIRINVPISTDALAAQYTPIKNELSNFTEEFQVRLQKLLHGLASHKDPEMRFLSVRLNYNEFYVSHRRRHDKDVTSQ
nr:Alp6 [Schizosaccharomyces pombe]